MIKAGGTVTPRTTDPRRTRRADAVLEALEALDAALVAHVELSSRMRERITHVTAERDGGATYREIVEGEPGPLLVEMLTEASQSLDAAGAAVRRAETRALYDEGLTMEEIASRFHVSRQRVSALLREERRSPLRQRRWTDVS